MDWHYTDKGRGSWTGWTWNKELFPDYRKLLKDLKADNGLRVTLNLHPAEGVRSYEEQYEAVARDNGVDPATKQEIPLDIFKKEFHKEYVQECSGAYEQCRNRFLVAGLAAGTI